jgi:hypothetical protein
VETKTIHLRRMFQVGERCREENWGGTLPLCPFAAGGKQLYPECGSGLVQWNIVSDCTA